VRKFVWSMFLVVLIGITIQLVQGEIGTVEFIAISSIWFLVFLVFYFEPETIKKIAIWKLTIERDVTIAEDIRKEVSSTAEELRKVAKAVAEDTYILASSSFLAIGDSPAKKRLEENLDILSRFVEPDEGKEDDWWNELKELLSDRN